MSSRVSPSRSIVIWHGPAERRDRGPSRAARRGWRPCAPWPELHHLRPGAREVHLAELQVLHPGPVHHRNHLLHPVVAGDVDPVLDQREQAPEREEDRGLHPHRGAGRREDHLRPDLVQVAAPGDDHQLLVLVLTLVDVRRTSSPPLEPPCSHLTSSDHEPEHLAHLALLHELVPGRRAPRLEVGDRSGSVASASIRSPDSSSLIACAVFTIGSGHDRPFRSSVRVIWHAHGSLLSPSRCLGDPTLGHRLPIHPVEHPLRRMPDRLASAAWAGARSRIAGRSPCGSPSPGST